MSPILITLVGGAVIGLISSLLIYGICKRKEWTLPIFIEMFYDGMEWFGHCLATGVMTVLSFILMLQTGFLVDVGNKVVVVRNDQLIASYERGPYLWKTDPLLRDSKIESYVTRSAKIAISTKPITANPEVRELLFTVLLELDETPVSYMHFRQSEWAKDMKGRLEYYLYEFENQYHGQLTRFYNPAADAGQQEEFQKMVFGFLKPHLDGAGIWFRSAYFRRP